VKRVGRDFEALTGFEDELAAIDEEAQAAAVEHGDLLVCVLVHRDDGAPGEMDARHGHGPGMDNLPRAERIHLLLFDFGPAIQRHQAALYRNRAGESGRRVTVRTLKSPYNQNRT
jgi:hypothetical protein